MTFGGVSAKAGANDKKQNDASSYANRVMTTVSIEAVINEVVG